MNVQTPVPAAIEAVAPATPAPTDAQASPSASATQPPSGLWESIKSSFQSMMPQWVRDNATRINQGGLSLGTAVIIGSVFRGKSISKDIWNAQVQTLKDAGHHGPALDAKIEELKKAKIMKPPGLHRQRMLYLPTAVLGLAVGALIKDKETDEQRAQYKDMPLGQYMLMRLGHAFDPAHHSRQTAGLIGALSGVFAIISAFSQPGGALISEAFVGATLISGFTGLTFINDPGKAKQALNICWATRLPFVVSGTYETLLTRPVYTTPLAAELKKTPEYINGMMKAMQEGVKVPRWGLGMGPKFSLAGRQTVYGGKAADAFTKSYLSRHLDYKRMDVSYPIGQWFNMTMATFGFLMAGADEKNKQPAAPLQTADTAPTPEVVLIPNGKPLPPGPLPTVAKPQLVARMQDEPGLQLEQAARV